MGTKVNKLKEKKMGRLSEDNTKPEFFALWSVRDLQVECARLNGVLKECIEIMEKASGDGVDKQDPAIMESGYTGTQEL